MLEKHKLINYEIIFIDDKSTDNTLENLIQILNLNPKVKIIKHNKNFGQTAALNTGIENSTKEIIITIDGDLQNDPEDIPNLLTRLNDGYDMVCGWRYDRKDPIISKKIPSIIANKFRRLITKEKIHDSGCSLKAFKREILTNISLFSDAHRFLPTILKLEGFKVGEVKVKHRPRFSGKTKYGTLRIVRGFLDLLSILFWYKYSKKPLHLFGTIGISIITLSFLIVTYVLIKTFFILKIKLLLSPLLIVATLLFLAGLQFILSGFLGEMQTRTYYQLTEKKSPNYKIIKK